MPGTGGGIPAGIKMPGAPSFTAPDPEAYSKKLAEFKQANPGMAGAGFEALLNKMAQQDEADRGRVSEQEKARTRSDFFQALIAAGESTRGQKGLGALLGGFGKSAGASEAAAFERADAQAKMRREQEMGMAKMRAELELPVVLKRVVTLKLRLNISKMQKRLVWNWSRRSFPTRWTLPSLKNKPVATVSKLPLPLVHRRLFKLLKRSCARIRA
jgi:hypothetical protein